MKSFRNQKEAGRVLAQRLNAYANRPDDVTVVALPSSMPIACEVAHLLNAPLDVFVVRELRHPGYAEYAIGAVATRGVRLITTQSCTPSDCRNPTSARLRRASTRR
jgi:putative phosphoribosyl transferase